MKILQLIDTLDAGGAERMAVNLANELKILYGHSYLCTTRREGLLKESIDTGVKYLYLNKKKTIDLGAISRLVNFIKTEQIQIIHAHSSSYFMACLVKLRLPKIKVVWHDHYGNSEFLQHRPKNVVRLASHMFSQIISVNSKLKNWALRELNCPKVIVLPNFISKNQNKQETVLKGEGNLNLVCLANLRPQKNHLLLINVFNSIIKEFPKASLHLVGKDFNDKHSLSIRNLIANLQLEKNIFLYGERKDVGFILSQAEIGVLGSKSEGLPLCVLEYGFAKLPVVCTDVGDVSTVITNNENGLLVPSENDVMFFEALKNLIINSNERTRLGTALFTKVEKEYSFSKIRKEINEIYNRLLNE